MLGRLNHFLEGLSSPCLLKLLSCHVWFILVFSLPVQPCDPAEFPEGDHPEHRADWWADCVWRESDPEELATGRGADRGRAGRAALLLPGGFQQAGPLPPAPQPAPGEPEHPVHHLDFNSCTVFSSLPFHKMQLWFSSYLVLQIQWIAGVGFVSLYILS